MVIADCFGSVSLSRCLISINQIEFNLGRERCSACVGTGEAPCDGAETAETAETACDAISRGTANTQFERLSKKAPCGAFRSCCVLLESYDIAGWSKGMSRAVCLVEGVYISIHPALSVPEGPEAHLALIAKTPFAQ